MNNVSVSRLRELQAAVRTVMATGRGALPTFSSPDELDEILTAATEFLTAPPVSADLIARAERVIRREGGDCPLANELAQALASEPAKAEQPGDVGRDEILRDGISHALTMLRELADEYDGDELPGDEHPTHAAVCNISHHLQGTLIAADEAATPPQEPFAYAYVGPRGTDFARRRWSETMRGMLPEGCTEHELYTHPPANDEAVRLATDVRDSIRDARERREREGEGSKAFLNMLGRIERKAEAFLSDPAQGEGQ